ncbi:hypothetical protein [Muricauda sp. MAR_2010_75]|jgi:hypothetical protein|uniref:hypothetical protein n=1 Tax=Allomuricauda sp. MAR_2010_75 TaxID=1250232 RepID=UPI000564DC68|nr:hypothetical protein [Muricauda sp. MAR_2010_75]
MNSKNIFRIVLAIIGGEIALIIFATIAQEVLFDGISYNSSPISEIALGGLATFIAAILAGIVARLIIRNKINTVPWGITVLVTVEMTYLILTGKTGDPIWFDILAGASLIIGIWLGFNYPRFLSKSRVTSVKEHSH